MKKILIISPNFPPVNAADMHRARQSLRYLPKMGWQATVVAVDPRFVEMSQDPLLNETIPSDTEVIRIRAFHPQTTRRFGLGNLGYRSMWFYLKTCNRLLRKTKYDLIYFTTTAFPVMVLGRYWKRKFGVPFIIDMQDPWRNDFYLDKPKHERPPKFFFAYNMDKFMEAWTMRKVDGIVSVSAGYPETLSERYPNIRPEICTVIPFGGAPVDFEVLGSAGIKNPLFQPSAETIHLVYIGRGGHDMALAVGAIFSAVKSGLHSAPQLFSRLRFFFVGTSYAADGQGQKTIEPIAVRYGIENQVTEITDRLTYFTALQALHDADLLVIPGSTDTHYTASKLYPYILAKRPLLAVFNENSSVVDILAKTRAGTCVTFRNEDPPETTGIGVLAAMKDLLEKIPFVPDTDWNAFEPYSAREATRKQVTFFNQILGL
ncbi:MAG TPA: glycosyltransferase [Bacteroidales bacterium]|nr:glycosyltransferase [Bacteroidales bacterium]HPS50614.1 glycosyltransferase [Bacteroidales bacterium]